MRRVAAHSRRHTALNIQQKSWRRREWAKSCAVLAFRRWLGPFKLAGEWRTKLLLLARKNASSGRLIASVDQTPAIAPVRSIRGHGAVHSPKESHRFPLQPIILGAKMGARIFAEIRECPGFLPFQFRVGFPLRPISCSSTFAFVWTGSQKISCFCRY